MSGIALLTRTTTTVDPETDIERTTECTIINLAWIYDHLIVMGHLRPQEPDEITKIKCSGARMVVYRIKEKRP